MRTVKGAEWLEIAEGGGGGNGTCPQRAYAREYVAYSLICLLPRDSPSENIKQIIYTLVK